MENYFLKVLHDGEIMDETSLDMLKGGMEMSGCGSLQSCGCYKAGNGTTICGNRNEAKPKPITSPTDSTTFKP
ncbi:MAG: hypothetical protein KBG68_04170 [Prevotella sp.]|jgi:hypothetical protein|nr:hypothetical protein [Prevotella sp.]